MPFKVHPRLHLDIGWGDLWFGMAARARPPVTSVAAQPRTPSDAHPVTTIDVHRSVSDCCQAMMVIAA